MNQKVTKVLVPLEVNSPFAKLKGEFPVETVDPTLPPSDEAEDKSQHQAIAEEVRRLGLNTLDASFEALVDAHEVTPAEVAEPKQSPATPKAPRREPPKAPDGVSRNITEFLELHKRNVELPRRYWFYRGDSTVTIAAGWKQGELCFRVAEVTGVHFDYLRPFCQKKVYLAHALLLHPEKIRVGVDKRRVEALSSELHRVRSIMERARTGRGRK